MSEKRGKRKAKEEEIEQQELSVQVYNSLQACILVVQICLVINNHSRPIETYIISIWSPKIHLL